MTYIKPEATSNQSSFIKAVLEQGFDAAQAENWTEVSNWLKQLPQSTTVDRGKQLVLEADDWQTAFDLALKMLTESDFQHKWEIAKLFPLFGVRIIPILGRLVLDEALEPETRWFICQILGNFPHQEVVLILVQLLRQTTDRELISVAGKTLTKVGDRAIDALIDLLSQPEYRLLAVQSLYYIRTAETITPLLDVATDSDPELRAIAVKALGSFHDRRVPPMLLDALQDLASKVRLEAAIALGFRPELCEELNLVTHLQPLLKDLNLEVCRHGAVSLGRMQQEAATTALYEVLQEDNTPISLKSEIVKALGWSEITSAVDYLQQALATANEFITQEIIVALGRISTSELKSQAAKVLIDFWHQNERLYSTQTKQILANSLGELGDRSGQEILEQLALDGDRKVKLYALAALKKLVASS